MGQSGMNTEAIRVRKINLHVYKSHKSLRIMSVDPLRDKMVILLTLDWPELS